MEEFDKESQLLKYTQWKSKVMGKCKLAELTTEALNEKIEQFNEQFDHDMYKGYGRKLILAHAKKRISEVGIQPVKIEEPVVTHNIDIKVANETIEIEDESSECCPCADSRLSNSSNVYLEGLIEAGIDINSKVQQKVDEYKYNQNLFLSCAYFALGVFIWFV